MGIVKKNAIMMIDFALDAERQEGMGPEEAIFKACVIRFRPIMMTTMAAMLGRCRWLLAWAWAPSCASRSASPWLAPHRFPNPHALHHPGHLLFFEHLRLYFRGQQPVPSSDLDWQTAP